MPTKVINVSNLYGYHTKEPIVVIQTEKDEIHMSPENARDLALNILRAAEASYSDAFIVEFMDHIFKEDDDTNHEAQAAVMLKEFRDWRETKQNW